MRAALILAIVVAVHTAAAKPPRKPAITLTPAQAAALGAHIVQPEYPFEARRRGISGRGVFLLEAEIATGTVHRVYMQQHRECDSRPVSIART